VRFVSWAVVGLALLAACTTGPQPASKAFIVTAPRTPFFKYGPAQQHGADFSILKDTPVTLVKRDFGYSEIKTMDGQIGYVSTEDIAPAPEADASSSTAGSGSGGPKAPRRSSARPEPESRPVFTQPEEIPLPEKTAEPTIEYRF
jgi:hypothetical protein